MLAVTPQQLGKMSDPSLEGPYIPKCHRSFRIRLAFPAMMDDCNGERGFQASSGAEVTSKIYSLTRRLRRGHFVIVTGGYRFDDRLNCIEDPCPMLQVDATRFRDPEEDVNLRSHTGRHPGIILGLQRDKKTMQAMFNSAESFCRSYENGVIEIKCRSGRHRSVGSSIVLYRFFKNKGYDVTVVHQHSPEWSSMRCGGRCDQCGPTPPVTPAAVPLVLKPAANQAPKTISKAASLAPASAAPWRTPPKAAPPKAKARPVPTETSRPSSRTITARPVPEFADDSPDETEEPQEDARAVAEESEVEEKEVHAEEDNEEDEEEEKTSEEEVEPDEKQKPQGNAEILSVLNKLTCAVTTLVERDQQKSSRSVRKTRSPSTSSRTSRKARRSRSARRGRSHERTKSSRKAKESRRSRKSSSSITRRPLPASSSKRARNSSPKKKKPVKEARPDKKATTSKSAHGTTARARSARPKTPERVPRSPSHPPPADRLLRRPEYQEHQRSELEDELWDHLTQGGIPSTSQVEPELLFALVDSATSWGNRDRVLWLVNRSLPTDQQQWQGIRVEVKIRANVYNTSIFKAGWMARNGWTKTVYARSRAEGTPWQRIQVGAWTSDNVDLQDPWSDTVCFTIVPLADTWRCSRVWLRPQSQGFVRLFHQLPQSQRESGTC